MPSDAARDHVEALEERIEQLQATVSAMRDDFNALRSVTIYIYGALVELSISSEQGANNSKYNAALDKMSVALDKTFGLSAPDESS